MNFTEFKVKFGLFDGLVYTIAESDKTTYEAYDLYCLWQKYLTFTIIGVK